MGFFPFFFPRFFFSFWAKTIWEVKQRHEQS
jgi:hypothetical protein